MFAGVVALGLLVYAAAPERGVEVRDRESGRSYFVREVEAGERVRLEWTHSIEKTPWVEVYEISGERFELREVKVKSFGAGVDQIAPEVENSGGWVTMRGTDKSFSGLDFINSPIARRTLKVSGEPVELGEIPAYAPIEVVVVDGPRFAWWLQRERSEV